MAKSRGFTFKQFHIEHDLCAMKVGTDGILLGAWSEVGPAGRILDIGTGSGLIALQLAQKAQSDSHIVAIEIDSNAAAQAKINVANSPWPHKVEVRCETLQTFAKQAQHQQSFDLIVSNPPYFPAGQDFPDQARAKARHTGSLNKQELMQAVAQLLSATGRCDLVLPFDVALDYIETAKSVGLHLLHRVDVLTKKNSPPHRMLLSLSKQTKESRLSQLLVHNDQGGYSADFIQLTRDYYLKM
ncbi:tRNA1(Val) (adenine(37)-N6)-methyltransferase [Motilimonas cestriensis]|uniref:tRNA1(Val) (adenine(37)-N6)-methyltransferase n=1 Tax=Motilimonas cestriensis TaxID=2742685 RepID=A0ABS8W7E1_9GAMM|nr:tRNA1(Val) (adenine(37)-N6)-methyltransferase [Motilimonas cestriensis]MCE2594478.1 tRNA1(Val) (adenine(37)-N6)-methyltransferase [Motilimonas cestriensis]